MTNLSSVKFPPGFAWSVATAAYQIEGAWNEDGRGESIWDEFCHRDPSSIQGGATGDVACDSYHLIDEDVQLLKDMHLKHYRFSLSWPRLLPIGTTNKINALGVKYYHRVLDKLIEAGIRPQVTLFHWDLPQKLEEMGGWLVPSMQDWFTEYCDFCFSEFGDKYCCIGDHETIEKYAYYALTSLNIPKRYYESIEIKEGLKQRFSRTSDYLTELAKRRALNHRHMTPCTKRT